MCQQICSNLIQKACDISLFGHFECIGVLFGAFTFTSGTWAWAVADSAKIYSGSGNGGGGISAQWWSAWKKQAFLRGCNFNPKAEYVFNWVPFTVLSLTREDICQALALPGFSRILWRFLDFLRGVEHLRTIKNDTNGFMSSFLSFIIQQKQIYFWREAAKRKQISILDIHYHWSTDHKVSIWSMANKIFLSVSHLCKYWNISVNCNK